MAASTASFIAPIEGGVATPGFVELCRYIAVNTNASDVFVFQNPRVLSLYTRRPASVYPPDAAPDLIWKFGRSIHARYFVVTDEFEGDESTVRPFIRGYTAHLRVRTKALDFACIQSSIDTSLTFMANAGERFDFIFWMAIIRPRLSILSSRSATFAERWRHHSSA